jgi:hypothetical protein
MKNIFWTGYCNEERQSAIPEIQKIVSKYGAVVGFKLFSDISLTIVLEIEELKIDQLYDELKKKIGIDQSECLQSNSTLERTVYLNISFAKGSGNLINETPPVPG